MSPATIRRHVAALVEAVSFSVATAPTANVIAGAAITAPSKKPSDLTSPLWR